MEQIIGELINTGKIIIINKYGEYTGLEEKLNHLELLVLKLHSTVEVARKVRRPNSRLHDWMTKFEDSAKQGDDLLREFKDRASQRAAGSSSYYFSSPWNFTKRIKRWISGDPDVKKLNDTITMLERMCSDIKEFLKLLELALKEQKYRLKRRKGEAEKKDCKKEGYCMYNVAYNDMEDRLCPMRERVCAITALFISFISSTLVAEKDNSVIRGCVFTIIALFCGFVLSKLLSGEDRATRGCVYAETRLFSKLMLRKLVDRKDRVMRRCRLFSGFMLSKLVDGKDRVVSGCLYAKTRLLNRFISRNEKNIEEKVEELVTRLRISIEAIENNNTGSPWLVRWHAKIREAVIEGDETLKTIKKFPNLRNRCGDLGERFERMIVGLEDYKMILELESYDMEESLGISQEEKEQPKDEERYLRGRSRGPIG